MNRVYTLTFHRALNYGAVLQAYALIRFLRDNGYDARVADYMPLYFAWQYFRPARGLKKSIDKYKKYQLFKKFRKDFLPLTERTYISSQSLKELEADALICGSDQVWNTKITSDHIDEAYFLSCFGKAPRKVAYAASAGGKLGEDFDGCKEALSSIDFLGVREDLLASDLVERDQTLSPVVVLDPSLLIKDYSEVFNHQCVPKKPFIVSYVVASGNALECFDNSLGRLKVDCDLPIINIGASRVANADINLLDLGPREWVTMIKEADFVVTNSFHGTAFSVNFEKQFIVLPHLREELNSRQQTLLKKVGLSDRLVDHTIASIKDLPPIDYVQPSKLLDESVQASHKFLLNALDF